MLLMMIWIFMRMIHVSMCECVPIQNQSGVRFIQHLKAVRHFNIFKASIAIFLRIQQLHPGKIRVTQALFGTLSLCNIWYGLDIHNLTLLSQHAHCTVDRALINNLFLLSDFLYRKFSLSFLWKIN